VDGVLVIDKPGGVTSHDVVAVARRALGERRIGHTGTLDPLATGVLPLACGRATRLVRFLTGSAKTYEAVIRFGVTTDTFDADGRETSRTETAPAPEALGAALATLAGRYLQTPPAHSAKRVGGRRAYEMARRDEAVTLAPVPVEVTALDLMAYDAPRAVVRVACSAGFYVRAFAHELGARVGTGACLEALRRTRAGQFGLHAAVPLEVLAVTAPGALEAQMVPMAGLLPNLPAVTLDDEGRRYVTHGRAIGPAQAGGTWPSAPVPWTRLVGGDGTLLALAEPAEDGRALHPSVVLI
jgi:tRNA pseudouridine55 synthase